MNVTYILLKNGEPVRGFRSIAEAETEVRRAVGKLVIKWVQEEQGVWFWHSPYRDLWEVEIAFV
jgi:hypothetical protein